MIFDYFKYENQSCSCTHCAWTGVGSEMEVGEVFHDLHEVDCPHCHSRIGVVPYPTIKEARANWESLRPEEKSQVKIIERGQREFDRLCLKTPDQLPEVTAPNFALTWDVLDGNTVLKHEDRVLFIEPSFFEGYDRFEEVVTILKDRYGAALKGVHLTQSAYEMLCGDKIWAVDLLKRFHANSFADDRFNKEV